MAQGTEGQGRKGNQPTFSSNEDIEERLERLDTKLEEVKSRDDVDRPRHRDRSALSMGLRAASELVAGILVGGLIGWQLDKWLGTSPILLIIFFLLGTAAGILGVIRASNAMAKTPDASRHEPADRD